MQLKLFMKHRTDVHLGLGLNTEQMSTFITITSNTVKEWVRANDLKVGGKKNIFIPISWSDSMREREMDELEIRKAFIVIVSND